MVHADLAEHLRHFRISCSFKAFFPSSLISPSYQIEIIQLVPVFEDIPFDLAAIDPGDKVLHVAGNKEGRVGNDFGADADVALLDEFDRLYSIRKHALGTTATFK